MTKQTFLKGTIILIIAGLITRFLGFLNRIVIARVIGEEGMGLYMMALPTMFLIIALTQLGLPVAISKRVAEAEAREDHEKIKMILVTSLTITGITSIIFTTSMILAAPFIATNLLTDERTLFPLITISPIVPIIAISAVIKGYFQGKQNMKPQSYALIIEQIVRITCVLFFIKSLLPYGIEFAAAGAMISVIIGELFSLIFLIFLFKQKKTIKVRNFFFTYLKNSKSTIKELFSISLPSTGSRMIGSLTNFIEPILVAQSLAIAGVSSTIATKQYGELTGYALPLLFLPTFITQSLSIALIPSISEASAKGDQQLIEYRIHQSIRISFASGALATIVLTLFPKLILTYMYGSSSASEYLVFMAPFFILLYIQAPLQAALQALDFAKPAMWNSLIGAFIKLVTMFLLASSPNFGMNGVAISLSIGVVLVTSLHLATLKRLIHFSIPITDYSKMGALIIITSSIGYFLKHTFMGTNSTLILFLFLLIILSIIYVILLFLFRFITREELKQLPIFANWL